jgi:tetratricopeptide (TPR) repeat protein
MRKQRRAAASRVTAAASRASARKSKSKPVKRALAAPARSVAKSTVAVTTKAAVAVQPAPPPPPPVARKPAFYEALAIYETGVRALQRHDFQVGADSFRSVIQRYPEERELAERATLFLQVCERETARRSPPPESTGDAVIAATMALDAGDTDAAVARLGKALERAPDSDHAHYVMAIALTGRGDSGQALRHLRQAIALNPNNRSNAVKDPDLGALRRLSAFQELVEDLDAAPTRRLRSRR